MKTSMPFHSSLNTVPSSDSTPPSFLKLLNSVPRRLRVCLLMPLKFYER